MQKRAPTVGNILVIVLFVLSCFGLLLFLWESFGGPVPLKPKGYQITVAFPRALALAEQSDVRISGVEVGHVVGLKSYTDGLTHAKLEISQQYAPIRKNMHAILRQKTLLGETYVQLIPEGQTGPYLPDGGKLPNSQVEPSVTLDDILSLLTPKTREDFKIWMQSFAEGVNGRGEQINAGFAEGDSFVQHANQLVTLLAEQEGALTELFRNTGEVFDGLGERDHQYEGLIVNGEKTLHTLAENSAEFADIWRLLPSFEHSSTVAFRELDAFAAAANPVFEGLHPAEIQLAALLHDTRSFAPVFNSFLTSLGPLTSAAKTGLPAVKQVNELSIPILENARPVLHNFDPFLQYLGMYVPEVQAFFANLTAATQAHLLNTNTANQGPPLHYLRTMQVLVPESLTVYTKRIGTNRANPYFKPGAFAKLGTSGLQVFSSRSCANSAPAVSGPENETISQTVIENLIEFHVANAPGTANSVPAPACNQQGPFTFNGKTSQYPQVTSSGYRP
jgi:phospholipid/cholesterol/gamma-HCH transport system substrate-binding protein